MKTAKVEKHSEKKWIPLGLTRVSSVAQRNLRQEKVDSIIAEFELDYVGTPVVNFRDGFYYIIDGQHRIEALKHFFGKTWEKESYECDVYVGLTEQEEADRFDRLNDVRPVSAFDRFRIRVVAGRHDEVTVKKLVEQEHLMISKHHLPGAIHSVGALLRVYQRSDGVTLQRTLRIIREGFGDAGFEATLIDGVGLLCQRYNGVMDEDDVVSCLRNINGGSKGLLNRAAQINKTHGIPKTQGVAAAIVQYINARRGGKKLPDWWKEEA